MLFQTHIGKRLQNTPTGTVAWLAEAVGKGLATVFEIGDGVLAVT